MQLLIKNHFNKTNYNTNFKTKIFKLACKKQLILHKK